jgi:hypothetical protein
METYHAYEVQLVHFPRSGVSKLDKKVVLVIATNYTQVEFRVKQAYKLYKIESIKALPHELLLKEENIHDQS